VIIAALTLGRHGYIMTSNWSRPFDDPHSPAPRPPARYPANYIQKLPKAEQDLDEWQAAVEALLLVAELDGPTMMARIGMLRAP